MREETARHLAFLDGWRGLAIGLVLVGHFGLDNILPGISSLGVALFFVLSGRLMTEILFVRHARLSTFFVRRFARIYPALLAFVVVTTVTLSGTPYGHGIVAAVLALSFTVNYAMILTHPIAVFDHLWSLCVEEHGYILLAGMAFFVRRRAMSPVVLIGVAGAAALIDAIVSFDILKQGYFTVFWRSDVQVAPLFVAGALFLWSRKATWLRQTWIAPVALGLAIALKLGATPAWLQFAAAAVLMAVAVVSIDHAGGWLIRILESAPMRRLGLWSYSLYLWQQPFYKMHRDQLLPTPVLLALTILAAVASFYLIERPARAAINIAFLRWSRRNRVTAPA